MKKPTQLEDLLDAALWIRVAAKQLTASGVVQAGSLEALAARLEHTAQVKGKAALRDLNTRRALGA